MSPDEHGNEYFIRSLYFDDEAFSAYYDKLDGVENREKYRLRFYNNDPSYIVFERKKKHGNKVEKSSVLISQEQAKALVRGDLTVISGFDSDFCRQAVAKNIITKPSAVTDYLREAYIHPASRTRITFDKSLRAPLSFDIFDKDSVTVPVFDNDSVILEIKYDEILPEIVRNLIPHNIGQPMAVSKYCLCRAKYISAK